MTLAELAEKKKNGAFGEISKWADETDINTMDDGAFLMFAAWSYEKEGRTSDAIVAYKRALNEFEEIAAAEALLALFRTSPDKNAADELNALADELDESALSDEVMLLARFEAARISKASLDEQTELLKEYLEDFYNDELYFLLYIELLIKKGDFASAKRYLGKFNRVFDNIEYKTQASHLNDCVEKEEYDSSVSVMDILYPGRDKSKDIPTTAEKEVSDKKSQKEKDKPVTQIKTVSLRELAESSAFKGISKQRTEISQPLSIEERFEKIIGMAEAKEKLGTVYRVIKMQQERRDWNESFSSDMLPCSHFAILGDRGAGKTLLATTIGLLLYDFGVRGASQAVSVEAKEFVDSLNSLNGLSDVTLIVDNIDRAYDPQNGKYGDFAWNIRKYLIEKKESVSVILTGSKEAVTNLFLEEPDISREIYMQIPIEKYSDKELLDMLVILADKTNWILNDEAKDAALRVISKEMKLSGFANGHSLDAILSEAKTKAAIRFDSAEDVGDEDMVILTADDFGKEEVGKDVPELLNELESLTGLDSVKKEVAKAIDKIIATKEAEKAGAMRTATSEPLHMVFKGAPGTGKTTVARIVGDIYIALGVLPGNKEGMIECDSSDLVGQYVGETAQKTKKVIERAMGGVLFIDEAYGLTQNQFGAEAVTVLIKAMEDYRESLMIIFAGYTKEMEDFLDLNSGLRSRINRYVEFEDYTEEEMYSIFKGMVKKDKRYLDPDTKDSIIRLISLKCKAAEFGNARGVRNLVNLVETAQDERLSSMIRSGQTPGSNDYDIIRNEDVQAALGLADTSSDKSVEELLNELDSMTGLESVKKKVHQIVDEARFNIVAKEKGLDTGEHGTLHLLFKGNAGTGKTTIARTLGEIYFKLGMLRKPDVTECDRGALVGQYVGETAPKTQKVIDRAMGGILFVDEAYTLAVGGTNDFGPEALTTIMKAMEDHRDDLMVIFAGYGEEIDKLLSLNQGLSSRFSKQNEVIFEDYTDDELVKIFCYQAGKKGMKVDEDLCPLIENLIRNTKASAKDFGNARGVRNLVETVDSHRKSRIGRLISSGTDVDKETIERITAEDIENVNQ